MPEAPPIHIDFDRRRAPRAARLHCVGGPLNGDRLWIWPVESDIPLRRGRYQRFQIDDDVVRGALGLRDDEGEVLVWQDEADEREC